MKKHFRRFNITEKYLTRSTQPSDVYNLSQNFGKVIPNASGQHSRQNSELKYFLTDTVLSHTAIC